jgi:hypothetical protein
VPIRHLRPTRILFALLGVAVAVAGVAVIAPTDAAPTHYPVPMKTLGVYAGSARPETVREFEQRALNGTQVPLVMEHVDMRDWNNITENGWFLRLWQGTGKKLVITTTPFPWGYSLQDAANGAFDGYWRKQLQQFVSYGFGDSILRVGHEMNCCYPWEATRDPQAFINMYRRYVGIARSIPGQNFTFDWNPVAGGGNMPAAQAYPGDDVVDVIGLDFYDDAIHGADPVQRWNNMMGLLTWHRDFAAAHGKPMSFPEWALNISPSLPTRSGGDNPYYIAQMKAWIASNNVLYASYFSHDNPSTMSNILDGQFPRSLDEFRRQFSTPMSGGVAQPPPPVVTTTTTTAPRPVVTTTTTVPPAGSGSGSTPSPSPITTPQDGAGPAAPQGFSATVNNGVVTLNWTPSPTADGYNIYRNGQHIGWPMSPGLASWTDRPPAGTHTYYIRGYSGKGMGPSTRAVTVTTTINGTTSAAGSGTPSAPSTQPTVVPPGSPWWMLPPIAPTGLSAGPFWGGVLFAWTPVPGSDGYNVFRNGQHIAWPSGQGVRHFVDTPGPGTFTYTVQAYNVNGRGAISAPVTVSI